MTELVALIEQATAKTAIRELTAMQPGDAVETGADTSALEAAVGFRPATPLREGIARFVSWYRSYRGG